MPYCDLEKAGKPFIPASGAETIIFEEKFCYRCKYDMGDECCDILSAALCWALYDTRHPEEWIYNEQGEPICTAFEADGYD